MTPLSPLRSLEAAMEAASKPSTVRNRRTVAPLYAQPTEKALRYEREHYAVSRLAQEAEEQQYNDHAHRRIRNTATLWSTCQECAAKRIRRMAAEPEYTHKGRLGRQMAETYGVRLGT